MGQVRWNTGRAGLHRELPGRSPELHGKQNPASQLGRSRRRPDVLGCVDFPRRNGPHSPAGVSACPVHTLIHANQNPSFPRRREPISSDLVLHWHQLGPRLRGDDDVKDGEAGVVARILPPPSSLRAQRSNPERRKTALDCFAALAMTNGGAACSPEQAWGATALTAPASPVPPAIPPHWRRTARASRPGG
jgi:hypothetical protein